LGILLPFKTDLPGTWPGVFFSSLSGRSVRSRHGMPLRRAAQCGANYVQKRGRASGSVAPVRL